ncbi:hypothetical protein, partial [Mesorhizobium sp.]|uniref:hypothetical protein n=1 Tax=Mesorhizobium sp. TaxID=1871066 RepID=UPI0025E7832B
GAKFCTVAALPSHGMDSMVCAASLRLLRHRMTKRKAFRPIATASANANIVRPYDLKRVALKRIQTTRFKSLF